MEATELVPAVAGEPVEVGDIGAPPREQHAVMARGDVVRPGVDHRDERLGARGLRCGCVRRSAYQSTAVGTDPSRSSSRASRSSGSCWRTFSSRVTMSSGRRSRTASSAPPGPMAASWRWSPTSTSVAPARSTPTTRRSEVGVVGHAGFVDDHHGAVVEGDRAVVEPPEQRGDRAGLDAGLGAERAGRLAAGGRPEHPVAGAGQCGRWRRRGRWSCRPRPRRRSPSPPARNHRPARPPRAAAGRALMPSSCSLAAMAAAIRRRVERRAGARRPRVSTVWAMVCSVARTSAVA